MKKIYILHGWAYSIDRWQEFVLELKKFDFEPVILKIPGLTAPLAKVWELDDYVLWLKDNLKHEKKQVILLGHSNGGRIALAYAAKYPKTLSQIILIDSAGIYHNELPIRVKRVVFGLAAKVGKKVFKSSSRFKGFLYKFARVHDYEEANPILRTTMLNLIRSDLSNLFSEIKTPTLIIWGKADGVTPLSDGKLMHRGIKGSRIYVLNTGRHSPMFTNTAEVVKIIRKELK
jgi:pimeloyl-ACP methyl ester carboxylesterase